MKREALLALLLLFSLLCTACAPLPEQGTAQATWPPVGTEAEVLPEELTYSATVALYLPSRDGLRLIAQWEELTLDHRTHPAEAVARALLAHRGGSDTLPLGGETVLSLSGERPVEVACGLCTVNLAATALQLSYQEQYTVCLSLARTLCELEGIHHVNVLIAERAIALDITGTLPCGAVPAHAGEELTALWDQMEAKRPPLGESATLTPLTATAVLYFPAAQGEGILPEVRNLTFAGQHPQQLTLGLLNALSAGPRTLEGTAAGFSPAEDLILAPELTSLETGGRQLTLYFSSALFSRLRNLELNEAVYLAAIVRTLTDFLPNLTQIRLVAGDVPLTTLPTLQGELPLTDGIVRRRDFADTTASQISLWLNREDQLHRVLRALPCQRAEDPAALLSALFDGPTQAERETGLRAVWPAELEESDVLGLRIEGDTLTVDLSASAAQALQASGLDERLAAYSAVQTLLEAKGLRRLRFLFDGQPLGSLQSDLWWDGEFWPEPALTDEMG